MSPRGENVALEAYRRLVSRHDPAVQAGVYDFATRREAVQASHTPRRRLDFARADALPDIPVVELPWWLPCRFANADQLLSACPSREDIQAIRGDFDIWFENELIDQNVLVLWSCTPGGSDSSLSLSSSWTRTSARSR